MREAYLRHMPPRSDDYGIFRRRTLRHSVLRLIRSESAALCGRARLLRRLGKSHGYYYEHSYRYEYDKRRIVHNIRKRGQKRKHYCYGTPYGQIFLILVLFIHLMSSFCFSDSPSQRRSADRAERSLSILNYSPSVSASVSSAASSSRSVFSMQITRLPSMMRIIRTP